MVQVLAARSSRRLRLAKEVTYEDHLDPLGFTRSWSLLDGSPQYRCDGEIGACISFDSDNMLQFSESFYKDMDVQVLLFDMIRDGLVVAEEYAVSAAGEPDYGDLVEVELYYEFEEGEDFADIKMVYDTTYGNLVGLLNLPALFSIEYYAVYDAECDKVHDGARDYSICAWNLVKSVKVLKPGAAKGPKMVSYERSDDYYDNTTFVADERCCKGCIYAGACDVEDTDCILGDDEIDIDDILMGRFDFGDLMTEDPKILPAYVWNFETGAVKKVR